MFLPVLAVSSEPFFALKITDHDQCNEHDKAPDSQIPPFPVELRHVFEIHTVDASHKGNRNKDGGNNGQHLHDLVHPITDGGQIKIQHAWKNVTIRFNRIDNLDDLRETGFYEILHSEGVVAIEWADKIHQDILSEHVRILFEIIDDESRKIRIIANGRKPATLVKTIEMVYTQS